MKWQLQRSEYEESTFLQVINADSDASYLIQYSASCERNEFMDRNNLVGLAIKSNTNALHIITSYCASTLSCILTCGCELPLVIACNACVYGLVCLDLDKIDAREINDAIC